MVNHLELIRFFYFPTHENNTLDFFFMTSHTLVNWSEPLPGISDHEIVFINILMWQPRDEANKKENPIVE